MALSFLTVGVSRHQNKLFSLTRLSRGSFLFRYLLKAHRLCGTIYCTAPSIRDTAFYHRYYLLAMPASISRSYALETEMPMCARLRLRYQQDIGDRGRISDGLLNRFSLLRGGSSSGT